MSQFRKMEKEQLNLQETVWTTGTGSKLLTYCLCISAPGFLSQQLSAVLYGISLLTEAAARFPILHTFVQQNSAWSNLEQAKSWFNLQLLLITPSSQRAEVAHRWYILTDASKGSIWHLCWRATAVVATKKKKEKKPCSYFTIIKQLVSSLSCCFKYKFHSLIMSGLLRCILNDFSLPLWPAVWFCLLSHLQ